MAEERQDYSSLERARNAAIDWLEALGASFNQNKDVAIGRLGDFAGMETGVESTEAPYWRLRLDYDPDKGAHYNAEFGKGAGRRKKAFCFPVSSAVLATIVKHRRPRNE